MCLACCAFVRETNTADSDAIQYINLIELYNAHSIETLLYTPSRALFDGHLCDAGSILFSIPTLAVLLLETRAMNLTEGPQAVNSRTGCLYNSDTRTELATGSVALWHVVCRIGKL